MAEAQMTIAQAEAHLDNLAISDNQRRVAEAQINEAKAKAEDMATTAADGYVEEAQARFEPISTDLCAARDGYAELIKEARLGRLTARDFNDRLNSLRQTHRSAVSAVEDFAATAERVEHIETDPIAYGEHIFNVTPMVRPTFDF